MQKHSMIGKERKNNTLIRASNLANCFKSHLFSLITYFKLDMQLEVLDFTDHLYRIFFNVFCFSLITLYSYLNLGGYIRAVQLTEILR